MRGVRYLFRHQAGPSVGYLALAVTQALITATLALVTGATIEAGIGVADASSGLGRVLALAAVLSGLLLAAAVLPVVSGNLMTSIRTHLQVHVETAMLEAGLEPTGVGHLTYPVIADRLREARGVWEPISHGVAALLYLAQVRAAGVAVALVVGTQWSWWPVAPLLASTLWLEYAVGSGSHAETDVFARSTEGHRRVEALYAYGTEQAAAKDVRIFGLQGFLVGRYRRDSMALVVPMWRARNRAAIREFATAYVPHLAVYAVALVLLVRGAATGHLGVGAVTAAVAACLALAGAWDGNSANAVIRGARALAALEAVPELVEQRGPTGAPGPVATDEPPRGAIAFEHVRYRSGATAVVAAGQRDGGQAGRGLRGRGRAGPRRGRRTCPPAA